MIPFHALLARDLADQTKIAGSLTPPDTSAESKSGNDEPSGKNDQTRGETGPASKDTSAATAHASLGTQSDDLAPLTENQERTLRGTQLLKLKAEAELERMQKSHSSDAEKKGDDSSPAKTNPQDAGSAKEKPVDPKLIEAGYQKAVELAPKAVEQMEQTVKSLKQKDPHAAYPPAALARKILEEIEKAQPRQDQQDQKKQDQNDQQKKEQKRRRTRRRRTRIKRIRRRRTRRRRIRKRKTTRRKTRIRRSRKNQKSRMSRNPDQKQEQPRVSRDRIEEAFRRVRERQQEKRERDRNDEGSCVRQSSRGEGLVMRHAKYAMTGLAVVALFLFAGQAYADDEPEIAVELDASEIFIGESVDYLVEIRNVQTPSLPDLSALRGLRCRPHRKRVA